MFGSAEVVLAVRIVIAREGPEGLHEAKRRCRKR